MIPILLSSLGALVLSLVLARGLRAARTRRLAAWGLAAAACTLGAGLWAAVQGSNEIAERVALSTVFMAAGIAHGVVFSIVALPPERTWLRLLFVPIGMWTGTFASMWFAIPWDSAAPETESYQPMVLKWLLLLLASGTLTAWIFLPFWTRNRGFVRSGSRMVPSVRFDCPRCGTRVDWRMGVAACTDCGLFLHVLWPADELHAEQGHPRVLRPSRFVSFACPGCRESNAWPCGDSTCASCGLKVSLHWNVHGGRGKEFSTRGRVERAAPRPRRAGARFRRR